MMIINTLNQLAGSKFLISSTYDANVLPIDSNIDSNRDKRSS